MGVNVTVEIRCIDCHRVARVSASANYFRYGGDGRGEFGLTLLATPEEWDQNINQIERCKACYAAYIERMTPIWNGQRIARQAGLITKTPIELVTALMNTPNPGTDRQALLLALKEKLEARA